MQTFLPYSSFRKSLEALDYRRLGKQRVEAMQLIHSSISPLTHKGWRNHPARKMWEGYVGALAIYHNISIDVWKSRGYNNTMSFINPVTVDTSYALLDNVNLLEEPPAHLLPKWYGDEAFHASHRSNLLRKLPEHYSKFGWTESPDLPYIWPV